MLFTPTAMSGGYEYKPVLSAERELARLIDLGAIIHDFAIKRKET